MEPIKVSVIEMYDESEVIYDDFIAVLDQSLNPRPPDMLYDKFGSFNPGPESLVLDLGCRRAEQACELSSRFGCTVVGVDLVTTNLQRAQWHITEQALTQSVQVIQGDIQQLPLKTSMFDLIWCRDVLTHMSDLAQTFAESARVLKPEGKMMVFHMLGTDLLTSEEAIQLCLPLASFPENMSRTYFEQAFTAAGFTQLEADELRSEWREYGEETDSKRTSKQLLRIARMRRNREQLIAQYGEKYYESELANCHWGIYQMMGKLSPIVYTLAKRG